MSLRRKLLLPHLAVTTCGLVVLGTVFYLALRWQEFGELDALGHELVERIAAHLHAEGSVTELHMAHDDVPRAALWRVALADGAVLAGSTVPLPVPAVPSDTFVIDDLTIDGRHMRRIDGIIVLRDPAPRIHVPRDAPDPVAGQPPLLSDGHTVRISVALPAEDTLAFLDRVLLLLWSGIPAVLILSATTGALLVDRSLAPIATLTATTEAITARRLDQRVPDAPGDDELVDLTRVVNRMLDRLEEAFTRQQAFTRGASHELRTPLAAIRTTIEVILRRERSAADYRSALGDILHRVEAMEACIEGLLLLARSEEEQPALTAARTDLAAVLDSALIRVHRDHPERGITLSLPAEPVALHGDARLLGILFGNVLDNACRHGAPPVRLQGILGTDRVDIVVSDAGAPIDAAELARLHHPFHRGDAARGRGGIGLGLSLARLIARSHGGDLIASSDAEGNHFRISLPTTGAADVPS